MPTSLPLDDHLRAIRVRGHQLADHAETAGYGAPVPTCPRWTVAHLVAHQAMVHRWATAHVTGNDPDAVPSQTDLRAHPQLPAYYREGVDLLEQALQTADDDLSAMTFLNDPPAPRRFWARRQAHETTIHTVDALSANLGRVPTTDEAAIDTSLAIDGLDELLRGFYTRGRSKLFDGTPFAFVIAPTDAPTKFVVHVAEQLTVAPHGAAEPSNTRMRLTGTAAALYLALWNRGDDVVAEGDAAVLTRWHSEQRVRWS